MDLWFFVSILLFFQIIYWYVSKRSTKKVSDEKDYFLAGRSVRLFPLMMTFLATQVGGGVILGSANEAYQFGWPVLFYPLGQALGLILLGCGMGRKLAEFPVSTIAQILELVYGSRMLRKIASILSIFSLFMILVAQIIASRKFLISLGVDNLFLFVLLWTIVILYTSQGGLRAVISTDMVQGVLFSVILLVCFGATFSFEPSVAEIKAPQLEDFVNVSSKLSGWLLMPLLFVLIEQDMGQRCFAGASPKTVSKASFLAGICTMIVCFVPVFLGSLATAVDLGDLQGGSVFMAIVAKATNPWLAAFVGCAVFAAIISTATSLINAISSNLSGDFTLARLLRQDPMKTAKAMTCLISIAAIFFAFYFDNVVDLLIQSYELSVSCLFFPVVMAIGRKRGHFLSALFSILFGAAGFFLFRLFPIAFPKEIASVLLSGLGYVLGGMLARYSLKGEALQR